MPNLLIEAKYLLVSPGQFIKFYLLQAEFNLRFFYCTNNQFCAIYVSGQ